MNEAGAPASAPEIDANIVIEIQKQKISNLEWQVTLLQAQLTQLQQGNGSTPA